MYVEQGYKYLRQTAHVIVVAVVGSPVFASFTCMNGKFIASTRGRGIRKKGEDKESAGARANIRR